jgi:hypothetical protein
MQLRFEQLAAVNLRALSGASLTDLARYLAENDALGLEAERLHQLHALSP